MVLLIKLNVQEGAVMRPTVIDVAKLAGVSRTTVSNVMNGVDKCTAETKERILKAARELGYKPNMAARALVLNKSKIIGLVLPSYVDEKVLTTNPFYNAIIDGVSAALVKEEQYDLIINCALDKKDINDWIMMRNLDGILMIGEYKKELLQQIDKSGVPIVLIDNYSCDLKYCSFVNIDDEHGGYLAAKQLIDGGYKKIGIAIATLDGKNPTPVNIKKRAGYKRALEEAGLEEIVLNIAIESYEEGLKVGKKIRESSIDALFASSDMVALGVLNVLLRDGVKIPADFGVVGFDNIFIAEQFIPSLTTINQNIFVKGTTAVDLLLQRIKNKDELPRRVILPVELITRET